VLGEITLLLEKWMSDEQTAIESGDVLEVQLQDFDGDLASGAHGSTLVISDLRSLRYGPARGVAPRSYRVRVVAITETDTGDRLLHIVEERRSAEDYGAIPMPPQTD
jgi:hypothetical protein